MLSLFVHTYGLRFHYRHAKAFDVFAFLDRAEQAGFSGVNVSAYGPDYIELSGGTPAHLARVRQRLEALGLLIDIETNGTDPDHLQAFLELAGQLGATHVRTYTRPRATPARHSADHEDGQPTARSRASRIEQAVRDLEAVAPLAERAGVTIVLENHEELSGHEVAAILQRVNHRSIRAVYDYGNSMVFLEDPLEALTAMGPWIRVAHLKDHVMLPAGANGMDRPSVLGVSVGQGNLPVVEMTRRLLAAGVERICFENVWGYHTRLRDMRGAAQLGHGAFAYQQPPYRPSHCLLEAEALARTNPAELVALEHQAFQNAIAWLARAFDQAGISLAKPLRPSDEVPPAGA